MLIVSKAIVIGGSAGSFPVVLKILSSIPRNFNQPLIFCLHRLKHVRHGFVEALITRSAIPVIEPNDKEQIKRGVAYIAPANYHLLIEQGGTFALSTEEMVNFSRPSINLTFDSASSVFRNKLTAIMLSGANTDGANGIKNAKERGAFTIVQSPAEATIKTMPEAAIKATTIDRILTTDEIIAFLKTLN